MLSSKLKCNHENLLVQEGLLQSTRGVLLSRVPIIPFVIRCQQQQTETALITKCDHGREPVMPAQLMTAPVRLFVGTILVGTEYIAGWVQHPRLQQTFF